MPELKKTYDIIINQDAAAITTATGAKYGALVPDLHAGNYFNFNCSTINSDASVFDFPANAVFFASLNSSLGDGEDDEAAVLDADFVKTDLSNGVFSFEMNTMSAGIQTLLGSATSKKIWLEIWFKEASSEFSLILQQRLTIYNTGSDFTAVPVPSIDYYDKSTMDALIAAAKPTRIADFATLSALLYMDDFASYFVTSLGQEVMWDNTESVWIYRGTGAEVVAGDEA